jgi:hypothetical protein
MRSRMSMMSSVVMESARGTRRGGKGKIKPQNTRKTRKTTPPGDGFGRAGRNQLV